MFTYEIKNEILIATMDMPGRSANVINDEFGKGFREFIEKLEQEKDSYKGVILTSAKKTFMAGADLEFLLEVEDPEVIFRQAEEFKHGLRRLEQGGKPIVAALNGAALGGGFELALACHHRIALDDPRIRIGLPEVQLGLIPGGGGITRVIRLLGLQQALPLLTEGQQLDPARALKTGYIHEVARDSEELFAKAVAWIGANPTPLQPWDQKGYKIPGGTPSHPHIVQILAIAPSMLQKKTYGNYPAAQAILNAGVEGAMVDFDTALRIESRYMASVATGNVAKNMIKVLWFQLNEINAGKSRPEGIGKSQIKKLGVLGAGMMGAGIAYVSARAGIEVVLKDVNMERAERGKAYSQALIQKALQRRRMDESSAQALLDRIHPTDKAVDLEGCDLVIEAVFENRELKAMVTQEAESAIPEDAVFASNTSTLPITGLAEASLRPAQFIGLHFFSPVDKMRLVEIIVGKETNDDTLARAFDYVLQIKKTPIVVNDSRGFYTSRVFATYVMEGAALLKEGNHPRRIEMAGLKAGMPVGPLALMDEVSLALIHDIRKQTRRDLEQAGIPNPIHPGHVLVKEMVEDQGRKGKAHGGGFYEYPEGEKKYLWPELTLLYPQNGHSASEQEMIDRMMFVQALETVRCMDEGVLKSVADANIGSIFGWGFAPFKGGTLQFINDYGVSEFVKRSEELAAESGERFLPPLSLREMAGKGQTF